MPAHWASALINCDETGLEDSDLNELDKYMLENPEYSQPVSCSENTTLEQFTFSPGNTRLTECLDYTFLRVEK